LDGEDSSNEIEIDIDEVEADAEEDELENSHNQLNPNQNTDNEDDEDEEECASIENDENVHHQLTCALKQATMLRRRKLELSNGLVHGQQNKAMAKRVFNIKNEMQHHQQIQQHHRRSMNASGIGSEQQQQQQLDVEGRYGGGQGVAKQGFSSGAGKNGGLVVRAGKKLIFKNENLSGRNINNGGSGGNGSFNENKNGTNLPIFDENSNSSKFFVSN